MIRIALYSTEDAQEQRVGAFLEGSNTSYLLEAAAESADEISNSLLRRFLRRWRKEARRLDLKLLVEDGVEGLFGEIKANQRKEDKK